MNIDNMNVEIFCLCKSAYTNIRNQVSLIQIFDTKCALGEPVLIDPFVLVAAIRFYKQETGTHRFEVVIRDEKELKITGSTEIVSIAEMTHESTVYFLMCNMPERQSTFGTYWFTIESGGNSLARIPLYVTLEKA